MNKSKKNPVGIQKLKEGTDILERYRNSRLSLETRISSDEKFWNLRHKTDTSVRGSDMPAPSSGWLFSTIISKHADIIENMPSPVCCAREESDVPYAETLNLVLPVILDRSSFKNTYSDTQYDKLKHGTGVYGVFWNPCADNGIGDIDIKRVDLMNLFWEPGITDIQDSKNIFYVSLIDNDELYEQYPWAADSDSKKGVTVTDYVFDSNIDTSDKSLIIDWYYKKKCGTKSVLHYIKFTGETLLYASENDPSLPNGFYDHGKYPFVFDVLYRESGTPYGYGFISITRSTQSYIDKLDASILEHAVMSARPRYMMKKNVGMNVSDFLDWSKPIVEVDGDLSEERVKSIDLPSLDSTVIGVRDSKISEIKEISSTQNYNYGHADGRLTSGVAIAAVQEAGSKVVRDTINTSWDSYTKVIKLVIELIRQFYDDERCFRITRPNQEKQEYIYFSAKDIKEKKFDYGDGLLYRIPEFDVEVRAMKSSAFSRLTQNETVLNLYKLGLFSPERRKEALIVLDALELEGKNRIIDNIKNSACLSGSPNADEGLNDNLSCGVSKKIKEAAHSAVKVKNDRH